MSREWHNRRVRGVKPEQTVRSAPHQHMQSTGTILGMLAFDPHSGRRAAAAHTKWWDRMNFHGSAAPRAAALRVIKVRAEPRPVELACHCPGFTIHLADVEAGALAGLRSDVGARAPVRRHAREHRRGRRGGRRVMNCMVAGRVLLSKDSFNRSGKRTELHTRAAYLGMINKATMPPTLRCNGPNVDNIDEWKT